MWSRDGLAGFAACLAFLPALAHAGVCDARTVSDDPHHSFEFTAGYSPVATTLIGSVTDRRFFMAGFNYAYLCREKKAFSISYTGGLMPVTLIIEPAQIVFDRLGAHATPAHSVYGFGVLPLGFVAEFKRDRRLHPFAELVGGLLASTEPVPIEATDATGLNFMFYAGGGARWNVGKTSAIDIGYRFLHVSNAGTTRFNPGLDNNVFYAGYLLRR
jgi:Lipid A 3-O-deacylase (PagL)